MRVKGGFFCHPGLPPHVFFVSASAPRRELNRQSLFFEYVRLQSNVEQSVPIADSITRAASLAPFSPPHTGGGLASPRCCRGPAFDHRTRIIEAKGVKAAHE